MFESAARIAAQVKKERVIAIWNLAAHQLDLRFDDLLHVATHAFRIVVTLSIDHDAMRNSFDVEYESLEVADLERRVVKHIEIFGAESVLLARLRGKTSGNFPNIGRQHAHR